MSWICSWFLMKMLKLIPKRFWTVKEKSKEWNKSHITDLIWNYPHPQAILHTSLFSIPWHFQRQQKWHKILLELKYRPANPLPLLHLCRNCYSYYSSYLVLIAVVMAKVSIDPSTHLPSKTSQAYSHSCRILNSIKSYWQVKTGSRTMSQLLPATLSHHRHSNKLLDWAAERV